MLALSCQNLLISLGAVYTVKQTVQGSISTHYVCLGLELLGDWVIGHLHNTCVCQRTVSIMLDATELIVCDSENDSVHFWERSALLSTSECLCVLVTIQLYLVVSLVARLPCHHGWIVLGEHWLIIGILTHICLAITAKLEYLLAERFEEVLVVQLGHL